MSITIRRIAERFIVPSILLCALIAVSFYGLNKNAEAKNYKNTAESMYRRSFAQLNDDFSEMEVHLSKLKAASSTAQRIILLDDIWRLSGSSVSLMSQIPSSHVDTNELNSFIVRVGDYAHALTKKLLNGQEFSSEDTEQIRSLQKKCREIAEQLNARLADGDIPLVALDNDGFFTSSREQEDSFKDSEGIDEFPTLIYDGPFSESTEKSKAKGLEGNNISEDEAKRIASDILKISTAPSSIEFSNGKIPSYDITYESNDNSCVDISITKQGGMLLWMMKSGASGEAKSTPQSTDTTKKLTDTALDELKRLGFENMHPTYAQYYENTAVINFAATQDGVILYSDLVKVWVDMSTNKLVGIDARNYIFSHTQRTLAEKTLSMEEAESKVTKDLEIEERNIALIPLTPQSEVLCYEFKGVIDEEEYIVYINVSNGNEEQIFKIIDSENGQLVI